VLAAREATLSKHVELTRREKRAQKASKTAKLERTAVENERAAFQAERERVTRGARAIAADLIELQSGDAERMVKALGRLTKAEDPYAFWRSINAAAVKGEPVQGSRPTAKDPSVAALEAKLEQITEKLTAAEERALRAEEAGHRARIIELAGDATTYPNLSKVAKGDPDGLFEYVGNYVYQLQSKGERVSLATALSRIEAQAAKILGGAPVTREAAPQATAARQGNAPPAKPVPPARQAGKAWDESKQALVKDPALWKALGLPGG
jgi:hypothetical protein